MSKETISSFEFMEMFPDEVSARKFFEEARWGKNGRQCPHCGHGETYALKREGTYRCKNCRTNFTVRVGSVMERSKIPLKKWLYGMYLLFTARKSVSSLQLSKELGITQKSAWFMEHRLRQACQSEAGHLLAGIVEVDETYIGGKERNKHEHKRLHAGRGAVGKAAVIGARSRKGRVKAMPVEVTDGPTLQGFIHDNVAKGSVVYTDDARAYLGLKGYDHESVNHSAKEYVNGMAHTNGIESVWAVLKRGHDGTFHHFSVKHLRRYVDEFAFRLNEGNVKHHTLERMGALAGAMAGKRITYKELIS